MEFVTQNTGKERSVETRIIVKQRPGDFILNIRSHLANGFTQRERAIVEKIVSTTSVFERLFQSYPAFGTIYTTV